MRVQHRQRRVRWKYKIALVGGGSCRHWRGMVVALIRPDVGMDLSGRNSRRKHRRHHHRAHQQPNRALEQQAYTALEES